MKRALLSLLLVASANAGDRHYYPCIVAHPEHGAWVARWTTSDHIHIGDWFKMVEGDKWMHVSHIARDGTLKVDVDPPPLPTIYLPATNSLGIK